MGKRAVQLRELLTKLGPSFVKVGQALSSRPDLLPKEYLEVTFCPGCSCTWLWPAPALTWLCPALCPTLPSAVLCSALCAALLHKQYVQVLSGPAPPLIWLCPILCPAMPLLCPVLRPLPCLPIPKQNKLNKAHGCTCCQIFRITALAMPASSYKYHSHEGHP